jgi:signal transduction histidine kinase
MWNNRPMTDRTPPPDDRAALPLAVARLYIHDFKNPLSAISANLSWLEAVIDDGELRSAVTDSALAVKQLLHMYNNFLQLARIEAAEMSPPEAVSLDDFIHRAVAACRALHLGSPTTIEAEGPLPSVDCHWPPDYAGLALENLLLACAANTPGEGRVTVRGAVDGGTAVITVRDTGVPIADEFVSCCFDAAFQSTAKSENRARYARAMGMTAVKAAAAALGGSVETRRDNDAQVFILRLPTG